MLVISQPENSDGFEGLSKVYSKMNRIAEAEYFIDLAEKRRNLSELDIQTQRYLN